MTSLPGLLEDLRLSHDYRPFLLSIPGTRNGPFLADLGETTKRHLPGVPHFAVSLKEEATRVLQP